MTADAAASAPDRPVRLLATLEPTATDPTRYHAGDVWTMPAARAAALVAAGLAVVESTAADGDAVAAASDTDARPRPTPTLED